MNTLTDGGVWNRMQQAPIIVRAYLGFAVAGSALAMSPLYASTLSAAIVPYCGWSGLSTYMFTIFFAVAACLDPPQRKSIYAVVFLLMFGLLFGVFDTYRNILGSNAGRSHFDNPYLTYSSFRPLITIGLPAFWGLLLISPPMRRWINSAS